ncbi:phosphomevalonate kinase [Dermacentor silvarum]|uniref:phosphomevalonate kinase n=1 Tax=Dermacentor silvarum TaxID=543639 RepID=UPI00189B7696|nr:phosphomevalonate kinase [Dermacentor silvarum]
MKLTRGSGVSKLQPGCYVRVLAAKAGRIGDDKCAILRLSEPIKEAYAKEHNLDYNRLLDSSDYKELYRAKMVAWGEEKRNQDLSFFCRLAVKKRGRPELPVWMVSDARRESDVEYFRETFACPTFTVRVRAREGTRRDRGWVHTPGIDDATTECGLDHVDNWDFVINNNDDDDLEGQLESVLQAVHEHCS